MATALLAPAAVAAPAFVAHPDSPLSTGVTDPYALAVGDFDGDSDKDLAVLNQGSDSVSVLLRNSSGGYAAATGSPFGVGDEPYAIAVGQLNGDSALDLATANAGSHNVTVLLGNGSGEFSAATNSPFAVGNGPTSIAIGNVNGGSNQDLVVGNHADDTVSVLLGDGSAGFSAATNSPFATGDGPSSVAIDDLDGDSDQDLALSNFGSSNVTVLSGNGAGDFTAATGSPFSTGGTAAQSVVTGDFDGDSDRDLAIANYSSANVSVLLRNALGGYTAATGSPFSTGSSFAIRLAAGDLDGDSDLDLAVANYTTNTVTVLLGGASGTFSAATGSPFATGGTGNSPTSVAVADLDGDSDQDLALANADSNNVSLLLNDSPPALSPATGSVSYTEDSPSEDHQLAVASSIAITDADDTNIESGSVTVAGWQASEDELTYTDASGITETYDDTTGTLTFTGSASKATYQALLQSVKYQNTSDNPSAGDRTVSFTVNDGTSNSSTATRTVSITATNDAPALAPTTGSVSYTEDSPSENHELAVASDLVVTDADDTNIESGSVTVAGWQSGQDELTYTDATGITETYNSATGTITLAGSASKATYEALLRSVKYKNTSDNPSTGNRTFSFTVNDGDANSNTATRTVSITATNDAPVLATTSTTTIGYVLAGGGSDTGASVVVDPNITVADADGEIDSATVQITGNHDSTEDLLEFTDTASITGAFNSGTGTLTLSTPSGTVTPSAFATALRTITYRNSDQNPNRSGALRTVTFQVTDGGSPLPAQASNTTTRDLDVKSPDLTLNGTSGDINVTSASFTWSTSDTVTASPTTTCSLSGPDPTETHALQTCSGTSKGYTGLDDGSYTFTLKSTDGAGNVSTKTKEFFVDTVAPNVTISGAFGPACSGGGAGATCVGVNDQDFSWTIVDPSPSSGGFAQTCEMTGGGGHSEQACTGTSKSYTDLAEGAHVFTLKVTDDAGNPTTTTKSFFVDTVNPTVAIATTPVAVSNSPNAAFTFNGVGDASPSSGGPTLTCRLDGATFSACDSSSGHSYTGLSNGTHTFTVRATDGVGRTQSASHTWVVDAGVPTVTLTKAKPSGPSNSTTAEFQFNFTDASPSAGVTVTCKLDSDAPTTCASGPAGGAVNDTGSINYSGLAPGEHTFVVKVTDNATNETSSATHTWKVDTTAPTVAITAKPAAETNDTSPDFTFQASDAAYTAGGFTYQCSLDGGQYLDCGSHATDPVSEGYAGPLAEGNHDFAVRTTDNAGNTSAPATYAWMIDTTKPVITIPFPRDGARFSKFSTKAHTVDFSCTDPLSNGVSSGVATCAGDLADGAALPHGTVGAFDFEVDATDDAGNPAELIHDYEVFTFEDLVKDDDPDGYWRLNEPSGSSVIDDAMNQYDGQFKNRTQSAPEGISGDGGTSRRFTGNKGYGFMQGIPVPTDELTMGAFVKVRDKDGNGAVDDGTIMQHGQAAALWVQSGKVRFLVGDNDVSTAALSTTALAADTFYHVVGTWDGGDARLYVDGVLESTKRQPKVPGAGKPTFYIGYGVHAPWLKGTLDEIAYFPTALSSDHVTDHYLADPPPEPKTKPGQGRGPEQPPTGDAEGDATTSRLPGRWTRDDGSVIEIKKRHGRFVGKLVQPASASRRKGSKARRAQACGLRKGMTVLSLTGTGEEFRGTVLDAVKDGAKCGTRKTAVTATLGGDTLELVKKIGKRRVEETLTR